MKNRVGRRVYHFNDAGIYLGWSDIELVAGEGLPANCTIEPPPFGLEYNQRARFESDAWVIDTATPAIDDPMTPEDESQDRGLWVWSKQ